MFRVVPDQLRISEGWVRCGQCDEVFDANAQLRSLDQGTPRPEPLPSAAQVLDWGPVVEPAQPVVQESTPAPDAFLETNPHQQPEAEAPNVSEAEWAPIGSSPVAPEHASPSFMVGNPAPTPARSRLAHSILMLLCVSMLLLLCLQVMLRERDRLAATVPVLRSVLAAICVPLACSISAPRQIEAIAIESSSLTSLKPGIYVLQAVLKNSVALDLATPALELTFTDRQDQVLLRRVVMMAAEWGGKTQISASSELALKLPLSVQADALVANITGYKLLAFYP